MLTIAEARKYLEENAKKGAECPCCKQLVKRYVRPMYSRQVLALINLYKLAKQKPDYYHMTQIEGSLRSGGGDFAKLRYWGFIVEKPNFKDDKRTSGFWAITEVGSDFVRNAIKVKSHVVLYNNKFLGFTGSDVSISGVLGTKFNYHELMNS